MCIWVLDLKERRKEMAFTFKKYIRTGRYRSFELSSTDIKLKGKMVGSISETRGNGYGVGFMIKKEKTENDPCPFKWIFLKKRFLTEPEARDFIKKHEVAIKEGYDLHSLED